MNGYTYQLRSAGAILCHGGPMAVFVNDAADANPTPLDALVRSGDYFITLATRLDLIAHELTEKDPGAAMSLEKIIRDLDYLQRNYTIDRKTK